MSIDKDIIEAWLLASTELRHAKALELALRVGICEEVLGGNIKGTHHLIVSNLDLAATAKLNTKVDTEQLDSIWSDLTPEDKDAIVYKPSLVAKEYKKLGPESKLHQALITKPGTPTLKVKPADKGIGFNMPGK